MQLTPELTETLASAVRRGVPIETACTLAGIDRATLTEWLAIAREDRTTYRYGGKVSAEHKARISALSVAITRARAEREAEAVERIREWRSLKGDTDWRSEAWYLEHHPDTKTRWGKEVQVTSDSTIRHEHTYVRGLDDASLRALAAGPSDDRTGASAQAHERTGAHEQAREGG